MPSHSTPVRRVSRLPNLFAGALKSKDSERMYDIFLVRLAAARRGDRMVAVCRDIRRMARRAGKPQSVGFTYFWEVEAHDYRRDFEAMWRTLRAWEKASTGETLDIRTHEWTPREQHQLIFGYAPSMYLRGRYRLGCRLMETALEMASHRKGWSFEWLWHVYKPVKAPTSIHDVTLAHFYAALGRDLSDWELWDRFLDGFDPTLFRLSGIAKEALRQNPRLIKSLFDWIVTERRRRLFSGTADGERDVVESPAKVRRRQTAHKRQLLRFDKRLGHDAFEQKLEALFPELTKLRRLPSFKELLRSRSRH